jgi:hypothetical protein
MSTPNLTIKSVDRRPNRAGYRGGYRGGKGYSYDKHQKTRMYIWPEGESVMANLVNRRERPAILYRSLFGEIFRQANVPEGTKARWSQKAGCSCGCSPGFILDYWSTDDISVSVTGEEHAPVDEQYVYSALMSLALVDIEQAKKPVPEEYLAVPSEVMFL